MNLQTLGAARSLKAAAVIVGLLMSSLTMAGDRTGSSDDSDGQRGERRAVRHSSSGGMFPMADPERMLEHMSRRLQLSESQQQEISNVLMAAQPQLQSLRDRDAANRKALQQLDTSDADYGAKVQNIATDNGQMATELTLAMAQLRLDIDSKLTPEQSATLREEMDRKRQRGRDGKRRRDGGSRSENESESES